jgi:hypothetical protein
VSAANPRATTEDGGGIPLFTEAVGSAGPIAAEPWIVGISGQSRIRFIFVDIRPPELHAGHTVMILVTAPTADDLEGFLDEAMPVIETFRFQ